MKIFYYISYLYIPENGNSFGFGCCEIGKPDTEISSLNDVSEIAKGIAEKGGIKSVTVINFVFLRKEIG